MRDITVLFVKLVLACLGGLYWIIMTTYTEIPSPNYTLRFIVWGCVTAFFFYTCYRIKKNESTLLRKIYWGAVILIASVDICLLFFQYTDYIR